MTIAASHTQTSGGRSPKRTGTTDPNLEAWVDEIARITHPDEIVWCDGSMREADLLSKQLVAEGKLIRLNPEWRPNSYLARTNPADVARVEDRTFICSTDPDDAGPTNNWADPALMHDELIGVFTGSMRGRTMYIVPFSMGPLGGAISQLGVEITDSPYVVLNMGIMTRMGETVLRMIEAGESWVHTVHSVGYPLVLSDGTRRADVEWPCNETKYIVQFPETREVWSYGSGYGGNALLSKKSFALRIASVMARDEGWLAEHMLLIKLTSPEGGVYHVAAAFPSACGKTNLSMLRPTMPGWTVETIGDDIAWLRPGRGRPALGDQPGGRLLRCRPRHRRADQPDGREHPLGQHDLHQRRAARRRRRLVGGPHRDAPEAPDRLAGQRLDARLRAPGRTPELALHGRRRPVPVDRGRLGGDPGGVPIDAIIFGGRRATNVPLVAQARSWKHGVFMGATISSEKTAAAEGTVGELRRDPFAMLPFCGYNMADYWAHWLKVGKGLGTKAPPIFQVNWFRKGDDGSFLWPGFGENSRVLEWIIRRVEGKADAVDTPIGLLPAGKDLNLDGLDLTDSDVEQLFRIDKASWLAECDLTEEYFKQFGDRVPPALNAELASVRYHLKG